MSRNTRTKARSALGIPWTVRRYKDRIVIEIRRKRIPVKPGQARSKASPDCRPEIW